MSRFYQLTLAAPDGTLWTPQGFGSTLKAGRFGPASFTSYVNGQTLPAAWNVEVDIPVSDAANPQSGAFVRIWGCSLHDIFQASNLNGKNIAVWLGMSKGLPLANPAQAGLVVKGYVFQAYGNWIGTAQTLDLIIQAGQASGTPAPGSAAPPMGGTGSVDQPKNIVLNWAKGTMLSAALMTCFATAWPTAKQTITISNDLVAPQDFTIPCPTLNDLSTWVGQASRAIIKTQNYIGVRITYDGTTIEAYDSTASTSSGTPVAIAFQDLIGQPTWIAPRTVIVKVVMRGDLRLGQTVTMPKALATNTTGGASSIANQQPSFAGNFLITSLRHVGESRNPSPDAWCSIIEATPLPNTGT